MFMQAYARCAPFETQRFYWTDEFQTYSGGQAVVARDSAAFFDLPAASGSSGLTVVMSGGDRANINGVVYPRNATINLVCGQATGALTFIAESPALHYSFTMTTPAACPTSGPVGTTGSQSGGNTCNNKPILVTVDATNYINQTYTFDTTSITSLRTVACAMFNSAWLQINNVPIGSRVVVSTCNAGVRFDTKIALQYSCTEDTTSSAVVCNDDSCTGFLSTASTAVLPNATQSTIYALIGGYAAGGRNISTVRVSVSPVAVTPVPSTTGTQINYPCGRPIAQTLDAGQGAYNTVVAIDTTVSQAAVSTFCAMYNSVYIQINNIANGSSVTATTCGGNNGIDTKIALFDACINQAAALNCNDDSACAVGTTPSRSSLAQTVARSSTLWVMVGSFSDAARGPMNVSITVAPNTITLPTCNNEPIAATIDASANGGSSTTPVSTISTSNNPDSESFGATTCPIFHGSWIRISNVIPGSTITVSTCNASSIDTRIALYRDCNTVTTTAACNDDFSGCGTRSQFTLTAAVYTEYYAYIGTYFSTGSGAIPTTVTITPAASNNTSPVVTYDCTYTSSRGNAYNFGALRNDTGDYIVTDNNRQRYFINMCRSIVGYQQCGNAADADMCQIWTNNAGQAIIGRGTVAISDVTGTDGQGATFSYSNGDGGRSSVITMLCNQTAGVGYPTFVSESPTLRYNFEWRTSYACATTTVTTCASRPIVQTIDFGNAFSTRTLAINGAGYPSHVVTDTSCSMWNSMWILVQNVPIGARLNTTTCSTVNNTDTKIGIYSTCTALNSAACNDDYCGFRSLTHLIANQTSYYILVGYYNNVTGPLTLTVSAQFVPAPSCSTLGVVNANNGEIQQVYTYTTGSVTDITETSCAMYKTQWVQVTNIAAGSSLIAHTCGGDSLDTKLAVFANCGDANALICNDDSCGVRSMVLDNIVQSTLWIQVGTYYSTGNGTVPLNITIMEGGNGGIIPHSCTYQSTRGNIYDLGALRLNTTDYIVTDPSGQVYYINLCGSIVNSAMCGNAVDADMCQTYPGGNAVIGRGNMYYSDIGPTGYGITVNYRGGDTATGIGYGRNATLKIYCNETAGRGYPTFVAEDPILNYQFTWQSSMVCPSGTVTTCDDRPVFAVDVSASPVTSVTVDTSQYAYDRTTDTSCRMYNSAYILLNNVPLGSVINATTCGGATIDTLIGLYSSCTALNSMACNDDSCALQSFLKYQGTNQTSYYILVGAFQNVTATITVNIHVAPYTAPTSPFQLCDNKPIIYTIDAANTGFSRSGLYYTRFTSSSTVLPTTAPTSTAAPSRTGPVCSSKCSTP